MADRRPTISDTELDVLKVLWERPAGTVREILTDLRGQGKDERSVAFDIGLQPSAAIAR